MPAPVDHEERRRRIARIAADLIAQGGMDQATVRNVAAAAGYSTAIVTHYFAHKRELLLWAYRDAANGTQARFDAAKTQDPRDLLAALDAFLPANPEGIRAWRVYFAFWSATSTDAEFAAEQQWWQANALTIIGDAIERRYGPVPALPRMTRMLLASLQGVAIQAALDPDHWPPADQRAALAMHVDAIATMAG